MRIILIIQSLIILAGAYYVYTLTRAPKEPVEDTGSALNIEAEVRREDESQTVEEDDEEIILETQSEVIITDGPNDMGMEFPTPDDDTDLEVR